MRVLIVKPTAFGDVAQALLALPALKYAGFASRLDWIVDEDYLPLLQACPAIDHAIPFPRRRWRSSLHLREILTWIRHLRRHPYNIVLDLQGLARSALMTRAARAPRRLTLASAREGARWAASELIPDPQTHAVDRYLAATAHLLGTDPTPHLRPLPKPNHPLPSHLTPGTYVILHPYSLWDTKLWPWENYQTLCSLRPGLHFVAIGLGPCFPLLAPNLTDLRGRLPLPTLLALLAHARAVVGTDSGPAHAAALFHTPLLTLFGATDPARTSPRAPRSEILTTPGLPCRPCLSRTCRHPRPMACLTTLTPAQVAGALDRLLACSPAGLTA